MKPMYLKVPRWHFKLKPKRKRSKPNPLAWWWRLHPKTRKEVRDWYGGAIVGHGSVMKSKAAKRAWDRLCRQQQRECSAKLSVQRP